MRIIALVLFLTGCTASLGNPQCGFPTVQQWDIQGRLNMASPLSSTGTAIDLWTTSGTPPTEDSLAEITLHRNASSVPVDVFMERFNISAMATANNGAYRFGVERSGSGQFHDIIFCFENMTPGTAFCPFKITTQGVFVSHDGINYVQL